VTALLVMAGAVLGAPSRWLLDRVVQSRHETGFPFGTLLINVLGSFVLGVLLGATAADPRPTLVALLGTGFCGSFTTFGSFTYETVREVDRRRSGLAVTYVVVSLAVGLAAAALGWTLGHGLAT
jgi:CrcB protein